MNKSRLDLFGCTDFINLENEVIIPDFVSDDIYKCRVIYSRSIKSVEFLPYIPKPIKTLQLVECNIIDYTYKFLERNIFDELKSKSKCDDILIVKHKLITDTSYSNIVFYDGEKWVTPSTPLLCGTKREYLLQSGKIVEMEISIQDLKLFKKAALINSMIDLEESLFIEMHNIY
jgi:4-amino-4-deoxychorismate lyase